eukprot:5496981-Alexandrium_andersonii.AAC.1
MSRAIWLIHTPWWAERPTPPGVQGMADSRWPRPPKRDGWPAAAGRQGVRGWKWCGIAGEG